MFEEIKEEVLKEVSKQKKARELDDINQAMKLLMCYRKVKRDIEEKLSIIEVFGDGSIGYESNRKRYEIAKGVCENSISLLYKKEPSIKERFAMLLKDNRKSKHIGSSFDDYLKERFTPEEIEHIDQEALKELEKIKLKKQLDHKKYCSPDCPQQEK